MYLVVFLYDFGGCEYDFPSDFSLGLGFVGDGGGDAPELLSLFEHVPYIDEIPGGDN